MNNVHNAIDNYTIMFGKDSTYAILRSFLHDLDGCGVEIVAHINAGRFAEAARGAHYLISSAQSFEATRLSDALTRVRSLVSDSSAADELAHELRAAVDKVRQVVVDMLAPSGR